MRKFSKKLFIFIAMILIVSVSVAVFAACDDPAKGGGTNEPYTDDLDSTNWNTANSKVAIDTINLNASLDLIAGMQGGNASGVDIKDSTITIKRQYVKNDDALNSEEFPYDMRLEAEGTLNLDFSRLGMLKNMLEGIVPGLIPGANLQLSDLEQISVKAVVYYNAAEDYFNVYGKLDLPKNPGILNMEGKEEEGFYSTISNADIANYVKLKLDMASFYDYDNLTSGDNGSEVALGNWLGLIDTLQSTEIWVNSQQTTVAGLVREATDYLAISERTISDLLSTYSNLYDGTVKVSAMEKTDKGGIKKLTTDHKLSIDITPIMKKLLGGKEGAQGNIISFLQDQCGIQLNIDPTVNSIIGVVTAGKLDANLSISTKYYYTSEANVTWGA